jgi:hypothetical protein
MHWTSTSSHAIVMRCVLATMLLLVLISHAGAAYRVQRPITSGVLDQEYKWGGDSPERSIRPPGRRLALPFRNASSRHCVRHHS